MKMVLNKCYGRYNLSAEAIDLYLKRMRKKGFYYIQTSKDIARNTFRQIDVDKCKNTTFVCVTLEDMGQKTTYEAICKSLFSYRGIDRTDPVLVSVVEKLGDKAHGLYAQLEVVDIPDGLEVDIQDNDGYETAHEKHRSW